MIQIGRKCPTCGAAHNPVSHYSLPIEVRFAAGIVEDQDSSSPTAITYFCDTCGESYCVETAAESP